LKAQKKAKEAAGSFLLYL